MSIYAILPSNSIAETFPENTTSNFTIPLSEPLDFPKYEHWKVGLLEIQIPITFYNFEDSYDGHIVLGVDSYKHKEVLEDGTQVFDVTQQKFVEKIPEGSYNTIAEILEHIYKIYDKHDLVKKGFEPIKYLAAENLIAIRLKKGQFIQFSDRLARILGFPRKLVVSRGKKTQAFSSITGNPWKDYNHIFIYSDLVEDRLVNNSTRALLGTVSIKEIRFGSLLVRSFLSPELVKLRFEHYSTINVQLRNEADELVRFKAGSVILKLKFTNARRNSGSTE